MTKDEQRIQKAIDELGEFYDTVQIFACRHEVEQGGTVYTSRGVGNWYARYGQIRHWLIREEERTREEIRIEQQEES